MAEPGGKTRRDCWCGNKALEPYSADYKLCQACGTLVSQAGLADAGYLVANDDTDFYGKRYWLDHQSQELGLPQIEQRARLDLPERCLHWLRHVLSYRTPPARVLEIGCAHGGLVALLRWAGFDATGLELSPWVAETARRTFQIPMLVGPIEQQTLQPGSFDVIIAHDVMEHLPDPETTLRRAADLLGPNGILFIQMPEYPDGKSHKDLVGSKDRFLCHTQEPDEHLYLYSKRAARAMLGRIGLPHVEFHVPVFDYDMYFTASRSPQQRHAPVAVNTFLESSGERRLLLALLDTTDELQRCTAKWQESEKDRADRLEVIHKLSSRLQASEDDRAARLELLQKADRLLQNEQQQRQKQIEELNRLLQTSEDLLRISEDDRAARLRVILHQEQRIDYQRKALTFLRAAVAPPPWQARWRGFLKKVARGLLPEMLRRTLRSGLKGAPPAPPPASQVVADQKLPPPNQGAAA